ncbi:LolA family protein [Maribellus maritimus]|uniref:LolA family protein n=1 Tax=Maribellus maritimus TaxID=2870838 RepID=UPI001EEC3D6A|nr:outer membrane lipoprotein-sorting protein [Maribellus maritimus]MCG6189593.1 outer membrane lipoprotein-sorting protein [Maribellus maritimus]
MKKSIFILIVFFLASSVSVIHAQNLKEILDKHFKAIGQEKLTKVETYLVKAKVNQMGMEIPMEMKMKRPDKFRMEMDMAGQKMIQAFDGKKGWIVAPWVSSEPQELSGAELEQAMAQADIDGELYNYEKKGHKLELAGKENIDGTDVYNLKLTDKNGNIKNYYIDTDKYLLSQVKARAISMGQEVNVTQKMVEYKDFDGIKMATRIISTTPMGDAEIIMEDIKFNPDIADSVFEKPAN